MSEPKRYRKKPIVIEAIQWEADWDSFHAICDFVGDSLDYNHLGNVNPQELYIDTLEGTHTASPGDYIIKGIKGEFYPCKPDIFELTYEEVQGE